ncbi:MAG: hypothetical protein DMF56_20505 [Acidobacteria bacterium]|nr:MAG: hypothetical protein DMF56_20505 [Acidobacteriota bacterium]
MSTSHLELAARGAAAEYWDAKLRGAPALRLPRGGERREAVVDIPEMLAASLQRAANDSDISAYLLSLAAFAALLSRYSENDEVLIAAAPRVWFRQRIDEQTTFRMLAESLRDEMQSNLRHRITFVTDDALLDAAFSDDRVAPPDETLDRAPLHLHVERRRVHVFYDDGVAANMARHFVVLLNGMLTAADTPIAHFAMLSAEEVQYLVEICNPGPIANPCDDDLVTRFEQQVARTPDAIAVTCEDRSLTYADLDARANALAEMLIDEHEVRDGDIVAFTGHRTEHLAVTILGILKTGAAYLPIDPSYPEARVAHMLADSGAKVHLRDYPSPRRAGILPAPRGRAGRPLSSTAYIIYTSGSTGVPKGVAVTHRNVVRLFESTHPEYRFDSHDVWTLFHSAAFDFSVWELWGALLYGGRVVIVTHEQSRNTEAFYELVARERVTVLNQTPSAFRQFDGVDATKRADLALRLVIFGGEALDPSTMRGWFERHGDARPRVINMYGITETTVFVTWRPLSIGDLQMPAVIGTPIPGWQIHLLDRHGNLVPAGVAGEIYVAGEGVALGYLHRPELNAQRFLPDRFAGTGTLYRSGDLARRINATEIEYLGRIDQQVKVRGFRIELGEIEQRLLEHPSIRDAAVLPHDGEDGVELAAFLFGAPQIAAHELRARLTETLPEYMVPSRFVSVPERPLTSNGKLDHRALLALLASSEAPAEKPASAIEETLLAIWSDVLRTPVRRDDSFFVLGGHSLKAARLIGRIRRELAVDVSLADLFTAPSVAELAGLLEGRVRASLAPIEPLPPAESYELSHAQRRLWVIEQFEQAEGAYNVPAALMLEGALDFDALHAALRAVVGRHESLRTHFIDGPRQVIGAPEFSWNVIDADEATALRVAQTEALHKFDLARDPLLRVTLVRIAADKHLFVFVAHHIVCDARSLEIFVRDVADAYAKKPLSPLAIQYKDFAAWQSGDAFAAHRAWWHELLDGELPRIDLPTDFPRPPVRTYRGETRSFRIAPAQQQRIDALAKKHGLTPVLLALVNVLLFRLTGQRDLITGHPVTGRVHPDLDDQIGMYVNTLPLRMRLCGDAALDETIADMSRLFAGAFDHQSYPFDRLVDELKVARDTARSPLFDVLVVVHDAGETALALDGIRATPVPLDSGTSKFDLSFYFTQRGGELSCDIEYDTALFHRDSVERWWRAFERVLDAADDARPDAIDVISDEERGRLARLSGAGGTPAVLEDATLVSLFEQQVDATPSAIAIAPSTTYRALDKQANRIANFLLDRRFAESGACVAVRLDRNADLIAAILGILKTGAAYVPLDPAYPDARAQFIIDDSGVTTVLDESKLRLAASFSAARPGVATTPCDAAYVLYTSGSTGEPKGVVVEQRSVVNVVCALPFEGGPLRVALIAPLIFDVSVHQLFAALFGGHEVHVISEEMKRDPAQLVRYFAEHAIDVADCTPTLFAMLLESGLAASARPPRHLIIAGEALPRALVERFYANGRHRTTRMTNAYGPTEACVYATAYAVDPDRLPVGSIPIGTPLTNVEILIVDDALHLVPRGCVGEICIGGAGLARGYLHRDALTAERFVAHPLRAGERLYRTGDYGRWNVDGQLEYLGRRDAQVKVRGHRLELGEVEAALRRHPQVRDAAAITIGEGVERDLAGYVAAPPSLTPSAIRDFLAGIVPDFLIPSRIVVVDALPLTASGKVDRKALPPLDDAPAEDDALPRNELEQQIAALWETVLQRKDLGVRTDFFAAGGQSLKAVQLVARLRELTGRAIAFSDVFRHPTIEAQARLIAGLHSANSTPITAAAPADLYECSHAQRRMFFLDRVDATGRAYQMPGLFRVDGALDERALREACRRVALRHESLRTTFTLVDGEPMQRVSPRADVRVSVIETTIDIDDEDALRELIARDTARRFDLERGPLWRITLFRIAPEMHLLLFNMHHLIADGRSIDVFAREISAGDELPPLAIQYKDFAAWQNTLALDDSASYWREKLVPPIAALELPTDRPRPAARSFEGRVAHATFPAELIARLDATAREQHTTLFAALVAAVKIVLQRWSGQEDIVTGSPVAGRERVELEEQIGLYVNTVVLRDRVRAGDSPADTLRNVGRTIAEALEHQSYPFDRLVSDLALPRDPSRSPLFDVLIAMQESPAVDLRLGDAIVRELPLRGEASKLDLGFHFVPRADGAVMLDVEYATALFDAPRIEKLIADVVRAAEAIGGGDELTPRLVKIWREILDEPEIEVADDFFELGGDSLRAMRLLARVERDLEVSISLGDFLLAPTIEGMIGLAQRARRGAEAIPVTAQAEDYELTDAQQRLWLLDRIDAIGSAYNIAAAFALDADLDVERFTNAVRALVARHESLRTRFITRDDEPRQRVFSADTPIDFIETADVDAALCEELAHRFDLANEALFRVLVINKRVVLFHLHHIIADAQSADVVLEELEALYRGESLAPLRIQSKDATRWLRARDDSAHREYWLQKLAPLVATLDLPADYARPAARTFEGALVERALPRELAHSLHELARERGVTPFVLFAAAVKALLHRYTGEEDIVVGTPVSGRRHADLERQVGLYLDTIVLRDDVRAGEPFLDLLDRVHETTTAAFEHLYPFDKLVGELALPRDTSRSPLFDVLLVHHARERTTFLGATPYPLPAQTSKFDLSIHVSEDRLELEYATDLFTHARIERLAEHLESLLRSIVDDPSQSIGELSLGVLPSRADGEESPAENILAKIDAVAAEQPCLVFNNRTLTFGEVRERADRLAAQLASIIKPGYVVAVTLDRSDELAIAMLATLKAGGVYAYLDPHLPPARFELLLNDCDPRALITNDGIVARESNAEPLENAGYIVYTSGSTGQPKGVVATRRCVDNLISWQERALGRGLRSLQFASLSFDVSVQEILFSLASGGTLIVPSDDERRDVTPLIAQHDIELVTMPFSALNAWFLGGAERIAALPSLTHIITSGEQLQITTEMRRFLEARPDVALHNQYGPSETHVVTSHTISASRHNITDLPPIGTPVANTRVFIVDPRLQPVPVGITGELLVGGANVADGYLRRDDLTRDRFIQYEGERVYRTGDRARWREDGAIEFLGRRDEQVKIRGFRVEPGEVEQTLRQHPRVRDAAVIVAGESGARELWAYVAGDLSEDDVRAHAARTLPDYMVPSRVIAMDALPLTSSGKLDRLALPVWSRLSSLPPDVSPRNAIESRLAAIFESVLQRSPIGIHDDFFAIGGHSLSATRFAARISRELGLNAGLSDVFAHPTVALMAAHLRAASPAAAPIEAAPPADHYPLSHAQQRMWVLEHLSADASAYHVPAAIRVRGPLDVARLERALQSLVDAHESFRTMFLFEDGEPRQRIASGMRAQIHIVDSLHGELAYRFDLAAGPLFRVALLRVADDDAVLFVNLHHIITDGWSLDLCIRQLLHAYESDARIDAPRVTYKDYAQWQRTLLDTDTYWRAQLADLEPLELPTDFPRPAAQSFEGKTLTFDVSADITQRFSDMAARHGASVFIALLAAVKALLHRTSGQRDFAVGSPIAGRSHRDLEDVAGCFINTLVLRDRVNPDETFASFLARVRETTLAAYEHQSYPFDRLVDELVTARDASRSPLFDVLVAMQNDGALDVRLGETSFREEPLPLSMAKFDLSLTAFIDAGALRLSVQYATALFEEETIRRMAWHLERLLDAVSANPDVTLRDIPLVNEDERQQLTRVMHGESAPVELTSLVDLFERAVDQWPDRVAVACGGESLTYRALDARANAIAQWLIAGHGVVADTRVGVRVERSVDLIAAMIGTLKAGGAYVPVETWYPEARASMILDDAQCAAVITAERIAHAVANFSSERPRVNIAPHHLAYVLYTSGSTGKPKGVMIQHHSVVNFAAGVREMFFAHADALRIGLIASVVFDASVRQIYPALLNGHELHIVDDDTKRDAHALVQWLADRRIDACDATPSIFAVMMDGGLADAAHKLRWFLLVGESFARALAERFHANGNRESVIVNSYGPTECTVESTSYPIDPDAMPAGAHLPIGRPLVNQSIWLLDEAGRLLPYGARGEICIGGLGLARGYLGRDELTAERFIAHPILRGERLYRTGDYGRWRNDGQLEFHGRRDGQVKVRGYRIELGDVEAALRRCEGVRDAAVVVHDADLAAYVVAENLDAIRAQLAQLLPAYMIPAWIVPIDAIPLGATGKIDRRALPPPPREDEHVAPSTDLELALAKIWSEVIGVADIGATTSFFTIGGNSIRAIQILSRMRRDLELQAPLAEFFARPTIRELATYATRAPQLAHASSDELSAAQRRLWIIDRMIGPTSLYNIPAALRIRGAFDVDAFKRAVDALVQRHESLRTTFIAIDDTPHLRIAPAVNCLADDNATHPFDLERGPLFRVTLSHGADGEWIVLFNAHHIIADAWSSEILVRELFALYRGEELPPLQFGPRDFASLPEPEDAREWWLAQLAPPIAALDLPTDHVRPNVRTYAGTTAKFTLDPTLAREIESLGRAHGATLFMTLLACVKALLHRYTGEEDIVIGTPVAGRVDPRMEDVVGLFVNTLALRDRIRADARFIDVLQQVRDTTAGALERQTVPFDALIDALQLERDPSRNALTDIFVSLRRDEATHIDIPNAIVTPIELPVTTSKFDLAFHFVESNHALALEIEYSTELFELPRVERLFGHLQSLIESILTAPETAVGDLHLGVAQAFQPAPPHDHRNIIDEFESIADRYADRTAIVYEDRAWTYGELDEHANRIAHALGDRTNARIALRVTRSEWLIAAMLGILKSGAAYVPIDPQWPEERAQFVIRDCECAVVLDDDFVRRAVSQSANRIGAAPRDPNALAYILYTSGSTGTPKGVMIEHRGIANLARAYVQFYPGDALRIACVASTAFDGSGAQIWSALLRGHTLHLIPDELRRDATSLVRALGRERIDIADATPSLFAMMLEAGLCESAWRPQRITLAGEALPPALAQRFYAGANRETRILNLYGPTECSVCATGSMIDPDDCATITIGKPIENVHVLLLDERGQVVPFGCAGEICIGGDGVARGYWKRGDLTAERFVPHPFVDGERMYRSGDYGRWRDDGNLEFLGRRDGQLKLRGYRIEAGEIEAALLACAGVEQAAVLLRANELVAWIVARNDVDLATLRSALARTLPPYMIPARFLRVDALPLSTSDKIDRKALLALEGAELRNTYVAPSTDAERDLAQAWQEVLDRDSIGVHENYFHLGGDSISAIQIVARLAERNWKLDVRTLFRFPTMATLAPHLKRGGYAAAFESESEDTDAPLLPAQAWFFENPGPDQHHFNQSLLLRAHERIDFDRFERAIHQVVERHDALRKGAAVRLVDLHEMRTSLTAIAEEEQRAIDLDRGPLLRAVVFHCDDADRVLLVIHHLAVDGVSWRIVLDDVRRAYDGIPLAPRSGSVVAWARALHAWSPLAQLPFWKRIDGASSDDPPRDRDAAHGTYANVRGVSIELTSEATGALERINAEWHTHHGDVLLTALSLACERWYGARTLRVAVEAHGREDFGAGIDVSNTVGWFTSIFPLVLELKRPGDAVYALRFQKEALRQVPNGGIGYGVLRYFHRALRPAEEPRIVVNYLGKFEPRTVGFSLADESPGAAISPQAPLRHELAITGIVAEERLRITIEYDSAKYDAATIDVFARHFEHAIAMLIAACESAHAAPTPADYTYAGGFALDELDELFREGSAS